MKTKIENNSHRAKGLTGPYVSNLRPVDGSTPLADMPIYGRVSRYLRGFISPRLSGHLGHLTGNLSGLTGDITGLTGNVSLLTGDATGVYGCATGIRVDLDHCGLTPARRAIGISIYECPFLHAAAIPTTKQS